MSNPANYNYPMPKNWQDFESLCKDLWQKIWNDPNTRKHGRSGQNQSGVDVYGQPNRDVAWAGVQCKGKDNTYSTNLVTIKELRDEISKAKKFKPDLADWTLATTSPRDAKIEKEVRKISQEHQRKGLFRVHVWFWEDITDALVNHPDLIAKYLPAVNVTDANETLSKVDKLKTDIETINPHVSQKVLELQCSVDSIREIRTQDIYASVLNDGIDDCRDLMNQHHYRKAIRQLEKIKERNWVNSSNSIKFRILTNLGSAHYRLNELDTSGKYFKEASLLEPENELAFTNLALAYSFESNDEKTIEYANRALAINPTSLNAYNILLQTPPYKNSLEKSLTLIPEVLHDNPIIAFCFGMSAQNENKFSDALGWFEKAVAGDQNNPVFKSHLGTMLMQNLWSDRSLLLQGQISAEEKETLHRAIQNFSEAIEAVENTDLLKDSSVWILNRGIAKKLLGEINEAQKDIEWAYEINSDDPQFIKHLALILMRRNESEEAISLLEKIKNHPEIPEASVILANYYNEHGKTDDARRVISEFTEWNNDPRLKFLAQRTSVDIYACEENYEKAEAALQQLLSDYPHEPTAYVEAAKVAYETKRLDEAVEQIKKAKELIKDNTPSADIGEIGDVFFGLKLYHEAVECYEKIADVSTDNVFTYKLTNAYYYAGTLSKVLSICEDIRRKYGIVDRYAQTEIWTLEETNDLSREVSLAKEYLAIYPNDTRIKIKLAQISYLLEDYATTDEILSEPFDIEKEPLDLGIIFASLLAARGHIYESLNLTYELRRKHFKNAEIHAFYQTNFLLTPKEKTPWLESDAVAVDTVVTVLGVDGKEKKFVIEDRADSDFEKNEFNINHPIIVAMIGKKIGDEVPLKSGDLFSESGVITEIKHKFIYASHASAEFYETAFPDRHDFRSMHVGNPEDENYSGPEKFREIVAEKSRQTKQALEFYQHLPITVGMLGKHFGSDGYESWSRLISDEQIKVYTASGDLNLLNNAVDLLSREPAPRLVTDITALQLIHRFDISAEIINSFGKPLIAPTTIHSLTKIIIDKKRNIENGYFSLVEKDGQLYKYEISPEQVKADIEYLENFKNWIKKNTEESPYLSGFDIDRKEKSERRDVFLPEFFDTLMVVKDENYLLFSEDGRLREIAQVDYGISGVWLQPILDALKKKNVLSREKYNDIMMSLASSNLEFIHINAENLIETLIIQDWNVTDVFIKTLDRLKAPFAEATSVIYVSTDFLEKLTRQNIDRKAEELLVIKLLETITESRNSFIMLAHLIAAIENKFLLHPSNKLRILTILNNWQRIQIFKLKGIMRTLPDRFSITYRKQIERS